MKQFYALRTRGEEIIFFAWGTSHLKHDIFRKNGTQHQVFHREYAIFLGILLT